MIFLGATNGPIAPAWAIIPVGFVALVVIALHVLQVMRSDMPPSRRRIRVANGLLMMFTTPLSAFALSIVNPATQQKLFAMSWILTIALVTLIFGLAWFDILNNLRIYRAEQREIRRAIAKKQAEGGGMKLVQPPDRHEP